MLKTNPLRRFLDFVDKIFFVIQSVCLFASVATVVVTVLARELFKISLIWGYEIACWFVILLLFMGMPHNLHYKTNLSVTFIRDISPKKIQPLFNVLAYLIEVMVIIMMASGFKVWITKVGGGKLPASGFTNMQYYGVIGVGIAFSALELICEIIDQFTVKPVETEETKKDNTLLEEITNENTEELAEAEEKMIEKEAGK